MLGHYLNDAAEELGAPAKSIDAEALETLQDYNWPGNVRQLVNASRRLTVTAPGNVITAQDIPPDLGGGNAPRRASKEWTRLLASWAERQIHNSEEPLIDQAMPEFERTLIEAAMAKTNGHRQEAAKLGPQYADAQDEGATPQLAVRLQLEGPDQVSNRVEPMLLQVFRNAIVDFLTDQRVVEQCRTDADGRRTGNEEFERVVRGSNATLADNRRIVFVRNFVDLLHFQ